MDIFGIGTRILNSVHEHARMARGTGRSYVLSDMVRDGDAIVFAYSEHAAEFARIQDRRGKTAKYSALICKPELGLSSVERAVRSGKKYERVFYDHIWLERYYATELADVVRRTQVTASMYAKQEDGL